MEAGQGKSLDATCNLEASKVKASVMEEIKKQLNTANKRIKLLKKKNHQVFEKKAVKEKLLFRTRKTGPGIEDWQALPVRLNLTL